MLERFDHDLLRGSVGNYRVAILDVAPRAFQQPTHYNADEIFYVKEGEDVLVLLRKGRRESFCVREGDVMAVPASSIVYSANTHRVVTLLNPVATPGRFEEFFPIGGEAPESFMSAFSDEVLQAAFNSHREELGRVFERQSKGEIWQASEEHIRELDKSCSRGGRGDGGSGSSEEKIKQRSLSSQKPRYSNNHGSMHMITGDECRHLRHLDMEVGIVNITRGSMMATRYTTRATKIAVVVEGSGYFEMACPHQSESGRSEHNEHGREERQKKSRGYKQVRSQIKEGSVIVLPAGHPATFVAGNEGNLAMICYGVGANNDEEVFLTGGNSVLKQLDAPAKVLVFGAQGREAADRVIGAQKESVFLRGPQQQGGGGVSDM